MKESQANSVRNLENLYSTVVVLGLSLAVSRLVDTTKETVPIKLELLPFFVAFLFTLIPFYHGALRHLDFTYVEQGGRQVRKYALLIDFFCLFVESGLLLGLAIVLVKPSFFAWGLVTLLAVDTVWGMIAHLGFSQDVTPKPELRWSLINLVTAVLLSVIIPFSVNVGNRLPICISAISILRTAIDYWWCWDFYYPSS